MFAVIKTGGKQYRVAEQDLITIDKISGKLGEQVQFGEVLLVSGDDVVVGSPTVSGAMVAGEVVEQGRGAKIVVFKKRRRKNSRRKRGHRQEFSVIRITEILTDGKKPSAKVKAAPRTEAAPQPARAEPAAPQAARPQAASERPQAEAKPEIKAKPAAEKAAAKPAKPKAAKPAAPDKKPTKPKAAKPAAPAKKPATKKGAAEKGKDKKK